MDHPYTVHVRSVETESPVDRVYWLDFDDEAAFPGFKPGQYIMVRDPAAAEPKSRAYSIASSPSEAPGLMIAVRYGSAEEAEQFAYAKGQALEVTKAGGSFTLDAPAGHRVVMLAAGSGVSPFRSYITHLASLPAAESVPAHLVLCDQTEDRMMFHREFEAIDGSQAFFEYTPTCTRADGTWSGQCGRIGADHRALAITDPAKTLVYACGPSAFVAEQLEAAQAMGVPAAQCRKESW